MLLPYAGRRTKPPPWPPPLPYGSANTTRAGDARSLNATDQCRVPEDSCSVSIPVTVTLMICRRGQKEDWYAKLECTLSTICTYLHLSKVLISSETTTKATNNWFATFGACCQGQQRNHYVHLLEGGMDKTNQSRHQQEHTVSSSDWIVCFPRTINHVPANHSPLQLCLILRVCPRIEKVALRNRTML